MLNKKNAGCIVKAQGLLKKEQHQHASYSLEASLTTTHGARTPANLIDEATTHSQIPYTRPS